jgi:hypothetical protein
MTATLTGAIRKRLTAPDIAEVSFAARGFDTSSTPARSQLEASALQFIVGYEFGIEHKDFDGLVTRLDSLEREFRGFAYEGAVMALAVRDVMSPLRRPKLTERFLAGPGYDSGPGSKHIFMAYIGLGFALARLPKPMWQRALPEQNKLADHASLRWLIMDGYGFHMAFFHARKWVHDQYVPRRTPWRGPAAYTNRAIDQGVGRAMWFVSGGNVDRLYDTIGKFAPARRSDLMSGAGLAAAYAGGVDADALKAFWDRAGQYQPEIAQGAVFSMRARVVADLVTPANEMAAEVFCGCTAEQASDIAAAEIIGLPEDGASPAYEVFRQRIQRHFT